MIVLTDFGWRWRPRRAAVCTKVALVRVDVHAEPAREPAAAAHTAHTAEWVAAGLSPASTSEAATAEAAEQAGKDVVRIGRGEAASSACSAGRTTKRERGASWEPSSAAATAGERVEASSAHSCAACASRREASLQALLAELVIYCALVLVL